MAKDWVLAQHPRPQWQMNPLHDARTKQSRAAANERVAGVIYFIGGDDTPVKIGYSVSPTQRLRALQAAHWQQLRIIASVNGTEADERAYHARFAAHRLLGEWFARVPEIEDEIARLAAARPNPFAKNMQAQGVGQ